jgi:succinoglycan biosynthesis protein ExoM
MSGRAPPRVAVCIGTFRRPEGLRRLLQALDALRFERLPRPDLVIVVVDNDPAGSARAVCDSIAPTVRYTIRYEIEATPGISHVRNRAARLARDQADLVAYLDDDEVPEPRWLEELLVVQQAHAADVVAGPEAG